MGYTTPKAIELRLKGKVRFTDDEDSENEFPRTLLVRLLREAEGSVERDLTPRYATPFQHRDTGKFPDLPSTTKETIVTMCELMGVIRVLGNDFGRGTVSDGGAFKNEQERLYKQMLERELAHHKDGTVGQWKYPPMENLATSLQNAQDDGTHGTIIVTTSGQGGFPVKQITDPSEDWFNGTIDP